MKNKLLLALVVGVCGLLLLTGCGSSSKNKLVCSGSMDGADGEITAELDDDDKVKSVSLSFTFDSKEDAEENYEYIKNYISSAKLDGKTITISDYSEMSGDNAIGKTKDEFVSAMESSGMKCK